MRWLLILLHLSMALQTTLQAADDKEESFHDAKNEKLVGADCRRPKLGDTYEFVEDCIIEDDDEHEKVQMVVLQEREYEDVPALTCKMYRSAITEECWEG